jgi:hypothetical protein
MRTDTRAPGWPGRWALRLGAAGALAGALALAPRLIAADDARHGQLDRLTADLARAHATIAARKAALAEKRRRVRALRSDPRVVEDIARDELGMIYPGELVIRVEGKR